MSVALRARARARVLRAIETASGRCEIRIGRGWLDHLGDLASVRAASGCAIVADAATARLFGGRVARAIRCEGPLVRVTVPRGEGAKTLATAARVLESLAAARLDRASVVVAVGGGAVSDLAGFVAAVYLRGVAWVAVPTTLLAMVDAAIGGKTAVNLRAGKNLAGSIHPPRDVAIDLDTLATLSRRERAGGLAEVVKIALARNAALFERLEREADRLVGCPPAELGPIVARAVDAKAALVERDERDRDLRLALNLGHTTAHAIEASARRGRFHHGEAVAIGLRVACEMAESSGKLAPEVTARVVRLLRRVGLPSRWPQGLDPRPTLARALSDKKALRGKIRFVLPVAVGATEIVEVTTSDLARAARRATT